MKIVFVKYQDPMLLNKPTENIYPEDLDQFLPAVVRDAGILIKEDETRVLLGEFK